MMLAMSLYSIQPCCEERKLAFSSKQGDCIFDTEYCEKGHPLIT